MISPGKPTAIETRGAGDNGELRDYMVRICPIWSTVDTNRDPQYLEHVALIALDVTDQVETTKALQQSEGRYATLAQIAPVGIFRTDRQGECIFVNDRWCQLAGMTGQEALGKGWLRALHPDDRIRVTGEWYGAIEKQLTFHSEYRFRTPQGKVSWVLGSATPERNQQGTVMGYVGTITDRCHYRQCLCRRPGHTFGGGL